VPPAEVVIIGAGTVGSAAAQSFMSMGAHVTVLDIDILALQKLYDNNCNLVTMISNPVTVTRACSYADIVVAAVRRPDTRPPVLITREMLKEMKPRSVVMDFSIDEGGCMETSRPTTLENPIFVENEIIHYCVPNIPSIVARTSTYAFLNSAWPYIQRIANLGAAEAIQKYPAIERGTITFLGETKHLTQLLAGQGA
jgi:alanine dehydrogenase